MKVSGINGTDMAGGSAAMSPGAGEPMDEVSRNLQKQIENLQKQMKELSANQETPPEIKMKKRQELQKQISELQVQLRQHQMEVKREEAQKQEEKASQENVFDSCRISEEGRQQSVGLSAGSMEAMLSADVAMKQADVHGSTAQKMENRTGVLEAEIKLDSARGGDTAAKEAELAEAKAIAEKATVSQIESLSQANESMKETSGADENEDGGRTDDEGWQNGEVVHEENAVTENGGTVADTVSQGTNGVEKQPEGIAEEQDGKRREYHPVDVRV